MDNEVITDQPVQESAGQTPTPQQADRTAIVEKYQQLYAAPAVSDTPAEQPPPAGAEEPSTSDEDQAVEQLTAYLKSLEDEIKALRNAAPAAPVAPATPAAPAAELPVGQRWVELLREGKFEDAYRLIREDAANEAMARFAEERAKLINEAEQRTITRQKVESEVNTFIADLRRENPDVLPLEEHIVARAQARLQQLVDTGKITDASAWLNSYKQIVNDEVKSAKALVQQIRGAGKIDALTTKKEVLSSIPVAPTPAVKEQQTPAAPEDVSAYLQRRQMQRFSKMTGFMPASGV
jgi:hypothetical protein